jgi:hypothetical protein
MTKISGLVKGGSADVGYYGDDFIQNRVTAIATFKTSLGEHKTWMKFPLQMVDSMSENQLQNIMVSHLNKVIRKYLFGRAFNMVRRLRHCPTR